MNLEDLMKHIAIIGWGRWGRLECVPSTVPLPFTIMVMFLMKYKLFLVRSSYLLWLTVRKRLNWTRRVQLQEHRKLM
ncbi:hypothetical protein H8I69_06005 [Serratia fonticola]|uniref:hypothetical protein n=1 Tax=Serratia fonticola TaxID=47917 RepID=UPI0015C67541|nr:hypothetical protein [Serratia fonticola]MBC3378671.1 hypothetical protein [Serratia fonticola]NYA37871.1 hypothetical protein [Serratia fonticola]